jgi:hypothetical protein
MNYFVSANNSELFSYDSESLENEFKAIDNLEVIVSHQIEQDYNLIMQNNQDLFNDLKGTGYVKSPSDLHHSSFDFESFFYGICCAPAGCFSIMLSDYSTREERFSFIVGTSCAIVGYTGTFLLFNFLD